MECWCAFLDYYFLTAKEKSTDAMERAGGQYMNQEIKDSFTYVPPVIWQNSEYTILSMKLSCQRHKDMLH